MGEAYRTWIILLYQSTETLALHCRLGLMFVCLFVEKNSASGCS